jgi:hypothetical protein
LIWILIGIKAKTNSKYNRNNSNVKVFMLTYLVEQQSTIRWRGRRAVQFDPFTAVVRAQCDQVALVGDDIVELELAEEAAQGGVLLPSLLACLDRDRKVLPVGERSAHDGVTVERRSPERNEHIDADQCVEVVGARFPALGKVALAAVREVTQVADRQQRALSFGMVWTI